jgi:hypothetical protein
VAEGRAPRPHRRAAAGPGVVVLNPFRRRRRAPCSRWLPQAARQARTGAPRGAAAAPRPGSRSAPARPPAAPARAPPRPGAPRIAQLTFTFPEDATTSTGAPFWSAPKRFPAALKFDAADPSHAAFVQARARARGAAGARGRGACGSSRAGRSRLAPALSAQKPPPPRRTSLPPLPNPPPPPGRRHPQGRGLRRAPPRVGLRRGGVRPRRGQSVGARVRAPQGREDRDRPQGAWVEPGRGRAEVFF